jgi:hypothetical protein
VSPLSGYTGHETLKGKKLTFHISSTPIANLVWQLDSMAGMSQGDGQAFRRLWTEKLQWTAGDERKLEDWTELGRKYRKQVLFPIGSTTFPVNCPTPYIGKGGVARNQKVRLAGLQAKDLQDYQQRLLRVIPSPDAVEMGLLVSYFEPRFQEWWKSTGTRAGGELAQGFKDAMHEYSMVDLAEQIAAFTEAKLSPDHQVHFHIIVRPANYGGGVAGTQIQNHMVAEMADREPAARRMGLLMHELFHHFYDAAPVDKHTALLNSFVEAPEAHSMGLYTYLNEALATAMGLVVDNRVMTPRNFVGHMADERRVSLDRTSAKLGIALYVTLEKQLRQRRSLFDGFVRVYIAAACKALGGFGRGPRMELSSRTVIARNPGAVPAMTEFCRNIHGITTLAGRKPLLDYPQLSGAVFLLTAELKWLFGSKGIITAAARNEIRKASRLNAAFVYSERRSPKAGVYVFVGDNKDALQAAQRAFSVNDEAFSGVRFAVKRAAD